ncbi:hypothetical protein KUTeg_000606 [Tegillarca granosa]|uniref:Cytochrome b-c1 complex subunit 7 n=1 Tax=Tegillarca granosa TaxID=220873 RepID=A0ABQ9G0T4_TEGGR|nr:hypothetical protein KUTeg_000606 [Tegillarca granosa]
MVKMAARLKETVVKRLMTDDCIFETPLVREAIKRLPEDVYNARCARIARATTLSARPKLFNRAH